MARGRKTGPSPPKEHQWKPGHSGNPGGRPSKAGTIVFWLKDLAEHAVPADPLKRTRAQLLAEVIWMRALKGDKMAMQLAVEYLEGKAVQRVHVDTPQPLSINLYAPDGRTRTLQPGEPLPLQPGEFA